MYSVYRNNKIMAGAVVLALLLCLPFFMTDAAAKKSAPETKPAVSESIAGQIDRRFEAAGFTDLAKMNAGFLFEQRYATTHNFTHMKLYPRSQVFLRNSTAKKLAQANSELMTMGYRIKIFDAYRPYSIQKILYAKVESDVKGFIANPYKGGSVHNRGAAVDMTIVHLDGSPVEMPSDFDTFNQRATIYYKGCSRQAIANRELLASVMVRHGFQRLKCEWWHFDDKDAAAYDILDLKFW